MNVSSTVKSIQDFSNFFDQQLYVHCADSGAFYSVKNGALKQLKFPPHLQKLINEKSVISKPMMQGTERTILYIFRLGDGYTLFLNDPGTGNVLNGFIMSLITLSSNVCTVESKDTSDMNSILLDKLVAEFDKEKTRFAVTDKRQKEEIIILEEQAREAYRQLDEKEAEFNKQKKQLYELAETYKALEKKLAESQYTSDFQIGAELKKKNELLRDNNKKLVEMIKKETLAVSEIHSEVEMFLKDALAGPELSESQKKEIFSSIAELFSAEKSAK